MNFIKLNILLNVIVVSLFTISTSCGVFEKDKKKTQSTPPQENLTAAQIDTVVTDKSLDGNLATVAYTSNISDAIFHCKIDIAGQSEGTWEACASNTQTSFTLDQENQVTISIRAVTLTGVADETPVVLTFKAMSDVDGSNDIDKAIVGITNNGQDNDGTLKVGDTSSGDQDKLTVGTSTCVNKVGQNSVNQTKGTTTCVTDKKGNVTNNVGQNNKVGQGNISGRRVYKSIEATCESVGYTGGGDLKPDTVTLINDSLVDLTINDVALVEQLSTSACVKGDSYFQSDKNIMTCNKGCRGKFNITYSYIQ